MTQQALPIDFPELPPLAAVKARANEFLKSEGSDCVVDETAPFLPNFLQGLWIVSFVTADGQHLDGGGLAVTEDEVRWVSSAPSDPAYIGLFPTPDEPDEDDARPTDDDVVEMSSLLTVFTSGVFADKDAEKEFEDTVCIMAIPAEDDPVHGIGETDKHATLLYFGSMSEHSEPARMKDSKEWFEEVLKALADKIPPFTAQVTEIGPLGHDDTPAQVWLLDSPNLQDLFGGIRAADDEIANLYDGAEATRYPEYTPHVTIEYAETHPPEAEQIRDITFDRLSLWWGNEHIDFPLTGLDETSEFEALFSLVASGFDNDQIRVPKGNGRLSGRWMDTPKAILEALELDMGELPQNDEVENYVQKAAQTAYGIDIDSPTDQIQEQIWDVLDYLDEAVRHTFTPDGGTTRDRLHEARGKLEPLADVDWTLYRGDGEEPDDLDVEQASDIGNEPDWMEMTAAEVHEVTKHAIATLIEVDAEGGGNDRKVELAVKAVAQGMGVRINATLAEAGLDLRAVPSRVDYDWGTVSAVFDLTTPDGTRVGEINRSINPADRSVTNEYFQIPPLYQNKGFGAALTRNLEDWYMENGIESIKVHANIDVGGYTWAKAGFHLDRDEHSPKNRIGSWVGELVMDLDGTGRSPIPYQRLWTDVQLHRLGEGEVYFDEAQMREYIMTIAEISKEEIDVDEYIASLDDEFPDEPFDQATAVLEDMEQALAKAGDEFIDKDDAFLRSTLAEWATTVSEAHYGEDESLPTMYDIATFGQGTSHERTDKQMIYFPDPAIKPQSKDVQTWPGKRVLLGSDWYGIKRLDPEARQSTREYDPKPKTDFAASKDKAQKVSPAGQIVGEIYAEWASEQAGKYEPAAEWAAAEPSQYPEHADLLSSSPAAERDLYERTTAALEAAGVRPAKG